jgi:hypothetical protein
MARFEYTRTIHHYSFQPPESISELEYNSYKQMLLVNPNSDITPTDNSKKKNSFLYILVVVGVLLLIIGFVTETWILVFLSIFLVLHPIVNTGILQSSINQDKATNAKMEFYNDLKRMILNSRNYNDFYVSYKNKYSPLHKNPYS